MAVNGQNSGTDAIEGRFIAWCADILNGVFRAHLPPRLYLNDAFWSRRTTVVCQKPFFLIPLRLGLLAPLSLSSSRMDSYARMVTVA